jgi:hypothetical protein
MDHVITFKDVLITVAVIGVPLLVVAVLFGLLALFNPFGSGH